MSVPEEENVPYIAVEPTRTEAISARPQISGGEMSSGSLDKIRDILFGTQTREYEKRFNRLEERLVKECFELREETKKRIDSLEVYIKQEVESLTNAVKKQQTAREEAIKELGQEQKRQVEILEKKFSDLDEQANQTVRDLRQQILEQSKNVNEEIGKKYAEILTTVERETRELRGDKANRATLSALFAELAMRLRSEP